ncbi:MAG: MGMT family protein [Methanocalculaceae archaeon]|jgi:methylated-DNA-[protein]-cysteine S-methyltransferase|nr:MGMT family protein [Methanocalculaceae archaeon]
MQTGSCKFGLWKVIISWDKNIVHQVKFVKTAPEGVIPIQFTKFLAGRNDSFVPLVSIAISGDTTYSHIYQMVSEIPYGETRTYLEIALAADTHPRVVGNAMAKNPTALIIPCHRVVATDKTLGGFTPELQIKKELLKMEETKKHTFSKP